MTKTITDIRVREISEYGALLAEYGRYSTAKTKDDALADIAGQLRSEKAAGAVEMCETGFSGSFAGFWFVHKNDNPGQWQAGEKTFVELQILDRFEFTEQV